MSPENKKRLPEWARRDRQLDMEWLMQNMAIFQATADIAFQKQGRGAIVVDTTSQPVPGLGNPLAYSPQAEIEKLDEVDLKRMVREYDPRRELVVHLLKPDNRASTYRVRTRLRPPG